MEMRDDKVRDADAHERTKKKASRSEGAPPARACSNREIADALFAFLGDYVAWENGRASERGREAESGDPQRDAGERA